MWKLFATVLAVSDTGAISISQTTTDFYDPAACRAAVRDLFPPMSENNVYGHRITIRAAAECRRDGDGEPIPPFRFPFPHEKDDD
jgi:hypothetical protein